MLKDFWISFPERLHQRKRPLKPFLCLSVPDWRKASCASFWLFWQISAHRLNRGNRSQKDSLKMDLNCYGYENQCCCPVSTHIKGLCGSFGDPLAQFAGDAGAPLYMWTSSQDPLQHTESISLGTTCHSTLTGNQSVDQVILVLHSQLT